MSLENPKKGKRIRYVPPIDFKDKRKPEDSFKEVNEQKDREKLLKEKHKIQEGIFKPEHYSKMRPKEYDIIRDRLELSENDEDTDGKSD